MTAPGAAVGEPEHGMKMKLRTARKHGQVRHLSTSQIMLRSEERQR
jgi:hypothetical protein